jgi:hypothetical protein
MDISYIGCRADYGKEKVSAICGDEASISARIASVPMLCRFIMSIRNVDTELAESTEINQYPRGFRIEVALPVSDSAGRLRLNRESK